MDSEIDDGSVFDAYDDDSDNYLPEPKTKAKVTAKKAVTKPKAAPKKMIQTTLNTKPAAKKRAKPDSDEDDDADFDGDLSNTPPSAKKQKKVAAAAKKPSGKPLAEIENDSFMELDDPPVAKPKGKKKSATETYQKLTQLEHIIKRPDTYIGSVEHIENHIWVFNKQISSMEYRKISYVPGFYKIFDEILVNAADNKQRDPKMSCIKVNIDREKGEISVENDGKGIPVEMHKKEGVYIPELVFGHLLAGSNFDDNEKKTVGGRNGYGAKLCNVFSTEFTLECQDSENGKRYKATWRDNMSKMDKAKITSNKSKDFVRVTFKPDFHRFGMPNGIDDDLECLLYRRVYDMAGTVDGVKVWLNGEQLKVNFKKYCEMYSKAIAKERDDVDADGNGPAPATVIFEDAKAHGNRWQIGFTVSDGSFQQVSFVNSIATTTGGTHVNYIADQICNALLKDLSKKMKGHNLKLNHVRNHIFIFINCLIENPAFTSQTKEQMTTKASAFGSKCVLSDGFIKKIRATEAIDNILQFAEKKADKAMSKTDGNKRSRISNEKLVDANLAGTRHGHECTLILTEGDSAKGLAVAGRAVLDPDRIGVFPLRGKMLNVRDASVDQILKNQEIQNIKQFLGLKHKQTYTDTKSLRYGHLMIMADQDFDGSHIKGLLINFLQVQFPSLLQIPDFFREFITPVVKVWQGKNPKKPDRLKSFFTMPQYEDWKDKHKADIKKWECKYFKGLGTSSNEDAQVYFTNLDEHLKEFHTMEPTEAELFELAFSKKKADARKEWLGNFIPGTYLDHSTKNITYTDFVNKELILFSMADNLRSIPSVVDGLKPGQRKVIYATLKRNQLKDKKVVELAGYISEQTAYHHGEVSLQQTIIGLAQNFVGSNNVNCLEPSGNFGSRLQGGNDAASARYIHTRLTPFARRVFHALDDPILETQFEDGKVIEPKHLAPILPMVLCNGADGIGTGWSTSIPNYNPIDIVNNLKRRMGRMAGEDTDEQPFQTMIPWFRGWKGTPEPDGVGRYKFNGIAFQDDKNPNEVVITELPIRMWTDDFKAKLEQIIRAEKGPSFIKDYKEFNDHQNVHFVIQMEEKHMQAALQEGLLERFKLTKSIGTTNLVAFDARGQIKKYEKVEDILEEFYHYRLDLYTQRRNHWLKIYHTDYRRLKNQARFIEEIIDGKLVVSKKKKVVLTQELRDRKYEPFPKKVLTKKDHPTDQDLKQEEDVDSPDADGGDADGDADVPGAQDFDYLLSMPIYAMTLERLERLKKQIAAKKGEYDDLEALDEKDLWCRDLDAFEQEWHNQMELDNEIKTSIRRMGRRVSKKIGAGRGRKAGARPDDDYEDKPAKASKSHKSTKAAPAVRKERVDIKPSQKFAQMFSGKSIPPKKKTSHGYDGTDDDFGEDDDFGDEDFAALSKSKPAKKPSPAEPSAEPEPTHARTKRAATTKAKPYVIDDEDSESDDDDFAALSKSKPAKKPSPAEPSAEPEPTHARTKRAATTKAKPYVIDDEDSESDGDDFAALSKSKAAKKPSSAEPEPVAPAEPSAEPEPTTHGRTKRAAAAKAKTWIIDDEDSESDDDDKMLGDVGAMVRGIGEPAADTTNGRLSLFAMSRTENGNTTMPKLKTKASRTFDFDDHDDTNYEMLAKPSPNKSVKHSDVDDSLSDDDSPAVKTTTAKASSARAGSSVKPAKAPLSVVPGAKKRGRPAGAKSKSKEESESKPKATHLSPAAKAYAARKASTTAKSRRNILSDDDDEDEDGDVAMEDSPLPAAKPRSRRPARAAAAAKPKKTWIISSSDDDDDDDDDVPDGKDESDGEDSDPYAMDDSDE